CNDRIWSCSVFQLDDKINISVSRVDWILRLLISFFLSIFCFLYNYILFYSKHGMSIELKETILVTASSIIAVFMATTMIFVRMKAAKKPTSSKKIILPPIFMSSGACMFLFPEFRLSGIEIIEAVLVGALFSILLIKNTKFEIK